MTSRRDNEDLFESDQDTVVLPARRTLALDRDDTPEMVFGGESTDTEETECKLCCSCHSCSSRSSRWMSKPRLGANLSDDTDSE